MTTETPETYGDRKAGTTADPNSVHNIPDDQQPEGAHIPVPHDHVRPAGPKEMENPPETWDEVDEEGDESFPASDPPGNY
ncbi:MAG: hypothetical protein ACK4GT_08030 [Pararhodobacter sp.]